VIGGSIVPFPVQCLLSWSYWSRAWFYLSLPLLALLFSVLLAPLAMLGLRLQAAVVSSMRKKGQCTCIVGAPKEGVTSSGISAGLVPKFGVAEDVLRATFAAADVKNCGRLTATELRDPAVKLIPPGVTHHHLERLMSRYASSTLPSTSDAAASDDAASAGVVATDVERRSSLGIDGVAAAAAAEVTIDFEGFRKLNAYLAVQKLGLLIVTVAVICLFFIYMQTATAALDIFAVREVDHTLYMSSALGERALGAHHITLMGAAAASIVFFVAGAPIGVCVVLCVLRRCCGRPSDEKWTDRGIGARENCLDDARVRVMFGFLYDGLQSNRWWWEGVVVARKLLLVLNASVLSLIAPYFQSLVASIILVASLVLQARFWPYESGVVNVIEMFALVCVIITHQANVAVWMMRNGDVDDLAMWENIISAVVLAVHVVLLLALAGLLTWFTVRGWSCVKKKQCGSSRSAHEESDGADADGGVAAREGEAGEVVGQTRRPNSRANTVNPLPKGWSLQISAGAVVEMQELPRETSGSSSVKEESTSMLLAAGWSQHDDGAGNAYYHHSESGTTQWEAPLPPASTNTKRRYGGVRCESRC